MKICLTCSHGGHLTEIIRLMAAFEGHDIFFVTYEGMRANGLGKKYTMKNLGMNPLRFLISIPKVFYILLTEMPDIVISTDSEFAIPVFYIMDSWNKDHVHREPVQGERAINDWWKGGQGILDRGCR